MDSTFLLVAILGIALKRSTFITILWFYFGKRCDDTAAATFRLLSELN